MLKFRNSTHSGYIDVDPHAGNTHIFESDPGTRWTVQMRTQALDDSGQKGEASKWSPERVVVTQGPPGTSYSSRFFDLDMTFECTAHFF